MYSWDAGSGGTWRYQEGAEWVRGLRTHRRINSATAIMRGKGGEGWRPELSELCCKEIPSFVAPQDTLHALLSGTRL